MFKRIAAALLWSYTGWAFDGLVAYATGQTISIGVALGVAIGLVVMIDPRHFIWRAKEASRPVRTQEAAKA